MQAASYTCRQAVIEWEMLGFEPVYMYADAGKKHNIDKDTKRSRLLIHSHIKLFFYRTNRRENVGGHVYFTYFISIIQKEDNVGDNALFLSYKY